MFPTFIWSPKTVKQFLLADDEQHGGDIRSHSCCLSNWCLQHCNIPKELMMTQVVNLQRNILFQCNRTNTWDRLLHPISQAPNLSGLEQERKLQLHTKAKKERN